MGTAVPVSLGLARTGYWARIDVRFGRDIGRVLAEAQRQKDQRRAGSLR